MIELTWKEIRDGALTTALQSLARQKMPYPTTLKILLILKAVEAEHTKAVEMAKILSEKYGVLDAKTGTWKRKPKVTAAMFEKADIEYGNTKCKLRLNRIDPADLFKTELSAVELNCLEAFIEPLPVEGKPGGKKARGLKAVDAHV